MPPTDGHKQRERESERESESVCVTDRQTDRIRECVTNRQTHTDTHTHPPHDSVPLRFRTAYFGRTDEVVPFLDALGGDFKCPSYFNPAEHVQRIGPCVGSQRHRCKERVCARARVCVCVCGGGVYACAYQAHTKLNTHAHTHSTF